MSDNSKFQEEPRICSPVQPMVVNNYYGSSAPEVPAVPAINSSPAFGVKLFLAFVRVAAVWWICWGWEIFK